MTDLSLKNITPEQAVKQIEKRKDTFKKYLAYRAFSASSLKHIKNAEHFLWNIQHPDHKSNSTLQLGTLFHLFMEKGSLGDDIVIINPRQLPKYPDVTMRTRANKDYIAEQQMMAETQGKYCLLQSESSVVSKDVMKSLNIMRDNAMRLSIRKLDECGDVEREMPMEEFLALGEFEVSHYMKHPEFGVKIKGRADWKCKPASIILDFKTTRDASPYGFKREIDKWRIDIQAGIYKPLLDYCDDWDYKHFYILAVENEPPFHANLYRLSDDYVLYGIATVEARLRKIVNLMKQQEDPDMYGMFDKSGTGVTEIELDNWRSGLLYNDEIKW